MRTLNPSYPDVLGVETVAGGTVERSLSVERGQILNLGVVEFDRLAAHLQSFGEAVVTFSVFDPDALPAAPSSTAFSPTGAALSTGWTTSAPTVSDAISVLSTTDFATSSDDAPLLVSLPTITTEATLVVLEARVRSAAADSAADARFVAGDAGEWELTGDLLVPAGEWTTIRVPLPGAPTDTETMGESWRALSFARLQNGLGVKAAAGAIDVAWVRAVVTGRPDVRRAVGHAVTEAAGAPEWTPFVGLGSPADGTAVSITDLDETWVTLRAHPRRVQPVGWAAPLWRHLDNGLAAVPALALTDGVLTADASVMGTLIAANSDDAPLTGSQPYDTVTPSAGSFDLSGRLEDERPFQLVRLVIDPGSSAQVIDVTLNDVNAELAVADAVAPTAGAPLVGYAALEPALDLVTNAPWLLRTLAPTESVLTLVHTGPLLAVSPADGAGGGCGSTYAALVAEYDTYQAIVDDPDVSAYFDVGCSGTVVVIDQDQLGTGNDDVAFPTTGSWAPVNCEQPTGNETGGSIDPDSPVFQAAQSYAALAAAYATYGGIAQLVPSYLDLIGVGAGIGREFLPVVAVQAMAADGLPVVLNLAVRDRPWVDVPVCTASVSVPELTWDPPGGLVAASVEVQRYDPDLEAWRPATSAPAVTAEAIDHEAPRNRAVRWRVRVTQGDRVSAWTESVQFINPCPGAVLVLGSNEAAETMAFAMSDADRIWEFAEGVERVTYDGGGGDVFVPLDDGPELYTRELMIATVDDDVRGRRAVEPLRALTRRAVAVADSDGAWWWAHVAVLRLERASNALSLHNAIVEVNEVLDPRLVPA